MNKIEKYLDSIYCNFDLKDKELQDLKNEMRTHILDTVNELKGQGYTESESIDIAIKSFGDSKELDSEILDLFKYRNNDYKFIFKAAIVFILILIIAGKLFTDGGTYTSVIFPLVLIPVYIIYKAITVRNYNKKDIQINIKQEYLNIATTLFIILFINYLIFPLNIEPSFMRSPYFSLKSYDAIHTLLGIVNIMIAFIPFGLFIKLNNKSEISLGKALLYSIFVFIGYSIIKILFSLLGSECMGIMCTNIVGVILGTTIGYSLHKIFTQIQYLFKAIITKRHLNNFTI